MSDKAEKKPDAAAKDGDGKAAKKGGLLTKLPVLLGGVMVIEAIVLFAGFKFLGGGPKPAAASDAAAEHDDGHGGGGDEHGGGGEHGGGKPAHGPGDKKKTVELPVVDFRAPNKISGRTFLFDVSIFVVAKGENEDKVKDTIKQREALIKDRIRTIIAQSDPEKLGGGSEPNLDTLRRQVKYQLDEIIGEGMIDEVLVPRCIPFRAEY